VNPIWDGFGLGGYPVLMTTHEFYKQKANALPKAPIKKGLGH